MKILLVEDNEKLANAVLKKLENNGYCVDLFLNGEEGLYAIETSFYDLLILDLGLPGIDGIDIIKKLRNLHRVIPILIISARDELDQRIFGLDCGADDYLCKPFELNEVIARVQALLRRTKYQVHNKITYNDLVYDTQNRTLIKSNEYVELSKRELAIFENLLLNVDTVLSKENIVEHISTFTDSIEPSSVETYVSRIRKKLGDSINLKTARGLGYILSSK
ncbi:response regulator transcription factor [Poseidonibacter ostreae]|jgi:DNA-binding response OmpR family regulator|uniref:Response regulator n=1 Tax=Poseidonibacter ostreae TaxID=2654171 RepID=A0A6L4WW53_9BACT|nr:response regulator transcription factor [Poseidonibacter ostreae]KAB7887294.1 response regulator [Poseidonibacter ostreae]KAB7890863.1 response regulator [Poseidonibacter ostreae]KAB7890885.1 response regulator [Poseidonibacter ostreae]MAC84040.1 DNA-binding response regulator [Arcobacter sp.]|tara:strand:+ start:3027 stop:3689 length:663 start_codon:yes stop_codon:yes gene_type:complete